MPRNTDIATTSQTYETLRYPQTYDTLETAELLKPWNLKVTSQSQWFGNLVPLVKIKPL